MTAERFRFGLIIFIFLHMTWLLRYWIDSYRTSKKPLLQTNFIDEASVRHKINFLTTDNFGLLNKHAVSITNVVNLAGGIPIQHFLDGYLHCYSVNEDVYKAEMQYNLGTHPQSGLELYGQVKRTIDFKRMQIINDEVQLQKKGTGFATNLFLNQVNEARQRGFLKIVTHAAGGEDYPNDYWDGYKVWAKYGYQMGAVHQNKYTGWRYIRKQKSETLNKLYWGREDYKLWEDEGFSWDGSFDLTKKSDSIMYLKWYLAAKGINVPLNPIGNP